MTALNLYLFTDPGWDYDDIEGIVVRHSSPEAARKYLLAVKDQGYSWPLIDRADARSRWRSEDDVPCEWIGTARPDEKRPGIVLKAVHYG